ncbi:MAG: ribonuclease P protein component [Patescibacteria group bacterium]
MLPRPQRLRKMKDFALLSQKGRPVFGPFFTLRFRQSTEPTRVGFVVSTKIFKRANKRNRIKRRLREALRATMEFWPKNMDLLFVAKPETLDADFQDIVASVKRTFEKIPEAMTKPLKPRAPKARRKTSVVYKDVKTK